MSDRPYPTTARRLCRYSIKVSHTAAEKVCAERSFTLRTYTHLLPTSEDRTRRAIDKALGEDQEDDDPPEPVDGLKTA